MVSVQPASSWMSIFRPAAAALLIILGLAGCPVVEPDPEPEDEILSGRWVLDGGGVVVTYWFYDDLTMHRESTVPILGTTYDAGYYAVTVTTLSVHAIGREPESYAFTIEGDTLTLTDPGTGSISFQKQATLDRPANTIPSVAIDGGDAMAIPGNQVSFTITADPSDASQDLACQWYVDGTLRDGETADTFTYDVPASGTHAIGIVVSDGFDVAADSIVLTPMTSSPSEVFEQWDGDSWEPVGVGVPEGTLDAFSYNGNLTVRFANNDLWTCSSGAWSELGTSAPTGTIQATSLDSAAWGYQYLLAREASGTHYLYDGSSWIDGTEFYPAIPSDTIDFTMLASTLVVVNASGIARHSEATTNPIEDYANQPGGPVRHIGIGDYGSTPLFWAVTDSGAIYTGNDSADPEWTLFPGITIPADAIDVFLNGGLITIRR